MLWMWYMIRHESKAAIGRCRDFGVPGRFTTWRRARCRLPSSSPTRRNATTSLTDLAGGQPMNRRWRYLIPMMAACIGTLAVADDRADYNRQSAERYIAMFRLADLDKNNV